mmetsp:Transcript_15988/g.37690  ORF Transcript_15988/g.37690 Transcript_15988/m.37690 type:complete len:252 (-) Transcript_15988:85-840(-)
MASEPRPDDDRGIMLASFAAIADVRGVQRIIEADPGSVNEAGLDGTTPLCAAALWGHVDIVRLLLDAMASPNARNESGPRWTALHAAALQEHGKACMLLLERRANPREKDAEGITPLDYASCSEGVWPLFAAHGHERVDKAALVQMGVLRRASPELEQSLHTEAAREAAAQVEPSRRGIVSEYSRPGSAYVVAREFPPRPGSVAAQRDAITTAGGGRRPSTSKKISVPIDILEEESTENAGPGRGLGSLGL